jgi:hypothetical protein
MSAPWGFNIFHPEWGEISDDGIGFIFCQWHDDFMGIFRRGFEKTWDIPSGYLDHV